MDPVRGISLKQITVQGTAEKSDLLAVEEPLEIRLGYGPPNLRDQRSISVTMRTPGHDFELALGFLFTEGIIHSIDDVMQVVYCRDAGRQQQDNVVRVELQPHIVPNWHELQRNFYTTSSCGVCGKTSIKAVHRQCTVLPDFFTISSGLIHQLPQVMRASQPVFTHTGGLHASALFTKEGELKVLREDVGRHNALDKVIGATFMQRLIPLHNHLLLVSGRAGFELVQKAVMAGISVMAAVGAPSSLAVELARQCNMTLIGFVRENKFNVYTGAHRISIA